MPNAATSKKILVGITTYAGNFETRLILRKVLRHFRWKNGSSIDLLVVSDGPIFDPDIYRYADYVFCRPGPSGLQQGELDSLHLILDFARSRGYDYILKSTGDVILNTSDWVLKVVEMLCEKQRRILSTHWFTAESWITGTKFFAADVDFIERVLPTEMDSPYLEDVFTRSICKNFKIEDVAYLIDSTTGESHEVKHELSAWQWEHAHRLYKFINLDDPTSLVEKVFHRRCLYPALRIQKQFMRTWANASGKIRGNQM
ncbi:MAG: hypothetical protein Q8O37_08615 [Sulfuricellaceae bacterium]|nr:hypothetical protein [Sulfuricellaceae bacterium]